MAEPEHGKSTYPVGVDGTPYETNDGTAEDQIVRIGAFDKFHLLRSFLFSLIMIRPT